VIKMNYEMAVDRKVYGMSDVKSIHHPPPKPGLRRHIVLSASLAENKRSKQKLRVKYADQEINFLVIPVLRNKMSPPVRKEIGNVGFKQAKG